MKDAVPERAWTMASSSMSRCELTASRVSAGLPCGWATTFDRSILGERETE
jgi:hypothetical protein